MSDECGNFFQGFGFSQFFFPPLVPLDLIVDVFVEFLIILRIHWLQFSDFWKQAWNKIVLIIYPKHMIFIFEKQFFTLLHKTCFALIKLTLSICPQGLLHNASVFLTELKSKHIRNSCFNITPLKNLWLNSINTTWN